MIKKLCSLRNKKGFTLVECVVAIAVFALMATVVMQLLALSIQTYTVNDRADKDLDAQLENLIKKNNLTEREAFNFAVDFLDPDGNPITGGSMSVSGTVNRVNDDADGRLELNNFNYSLDESLGTSSTPESSSDPDAENLSVIKSYMHLYGSRGFESVYVKEASNTVTDGVHTINLQFKLNDPDKILGKMRINSIKLALPASAYEFRPNAGSSDLNILILGQTIRMNLPKDKTAKESYDFNIQFKIKDADYAEYGSFEKYFLNSDTPSTDKSETFVENINALGVYNVKKGTVQVKE